MKTGSDEKSSGGIFPPSFALPIRQAFLIAHMNGLLWLRRYPASITFTAMIPFAFLFIVFVIGGGQYTHMAFAGSLVSAAAGYGLATGNNIITWKVDYKMQDVFVASPVSSFTYMAGIALAELLFGLPAFVILAVLVVIFSSNFLYSTAIVIATLLLLWASTSSIGYFISTRATHPRFVESFIAFLRIAIVVVPPVFYPVSIVPAEELRYVAFAIPTTHASLILQHGMGISQTLEGWSPEIGFAVIFAYMIGFALLAKTKAVWREK
ncbi:MAG TPA: ABC transporter permease [Nitrososphaera sp.]|nr:ABC transporter permease [Thermoproteota archaeon]HZA48603.1 ABC transporter permease [Nitrososphaera sp.]